MEGISRRGAENRRNQEPKPSALFLIQRTPHREARLIEDMGIDHRRGDIGMTEEFLHRADIVAIL
jgi:hypothetical protein